MDIKKYGGRYAAIVRKLHDEGVLARYPHQEERDDLTYDLGIDITYYFKGMTPAKFAKYADDILLLAFTEAQRYADYKYKFARLVVELHRTKRGVEAIGSTWTYTAAKHTDADIMVYGEEALGYTLPEDYKKRPFLINKIRDILGIPEGVSPGAYVNKQRPYKVLSLIVCIRAGLSDVTFLETGETSLKELETKGKTGLQESGPA